MDADNGNVLVPSTDCEVCGHSGYLHVVITHPGDDSSGAFILCKSCTDDAVSIAPVFAFDLTLMPIRTSSQESLF